MKKLAFFVNDTKLLTMELNNYSCEYTKNVYHALHLHYLIKICRTQNVSSSKHGKRKGSQCIHRSHRERIRQAYGGDWAIARLKNTPILQTTKMAQSSFKKHIVVSSPNIWRKSWKDPSKALSKFPVYCRVLKKVTQETIMSGKRVIFSFTKICAK